MVTYNISLTEDLALIIDKKIKDYKCSSINEFFQDLLYKKFVFNKKINTNISNLDIESIQPETKEYIKMSKIMKNKKEFVKYNNFREKLNF